MNDIDFDNFDDDLEDDLDLEDEDSTEKDTEEDESSGEDFLSGFMDTMGLSLDGEGRSLAKPWMKYHTFHLLTKVEDVRKLIHDCLEVGHCALDLETEGFDNRIEYDEKGDPYTVHKIVGYCIGLQGQGYYIPVRHRWDRLYSPTNPNVDDIVGAEAAIKELCLASQPVIDPEAAKRDPLGAKELVEPPKVVIKFWHSKFDQEFLYPITGIDWWHPDSFEDGMLASYTIYTDGIHGLKENASTHLSVQDPDDPKKSYAYEMIKFKDLFPKGKSQKSLGFYDLVPSENGEGWNCVLYGCSDGICTDLLCDKLVPLASDKKYRGFYRLEKQVVQAVRIIERARVLIDKSKIVGLLEEAERELKNYEDRIVKFAEQYELKNFNPASSSQLADLLFSGKYVKGLQKPPMTDKGQFKTDEKTLVQYLDKPDCPEVVSWIIKHRQINKVKGTYLENLANNTDENDQIRLNFKQTGAATGRFTAPKGDADHGFAGVPIQGIPAKNDPSKPQVAHSLRRMFVARLGYIMVKADYASQELRIAASVSGEPKWINEYVKELETGIPADLHAMTAEAFFPGLKKSDPDFKLKRGQGKTANFALVYGGGVGAVQRATNCDQTEGGRLLKAFHESVPKFSKWVAAQHDNVKKLKGVRTGFGRFIAIPDAAITAKQLMERDLESQKRKVDNGKMPASEIKPMSNKIAFKEAKRIQAACERKSTNFPIQGSGADILKISLVLLIKEFHIRGWLKNGGDDSVRLVMTVHDEIVFEIRKDRVAEALPILKKIMEYPSTIAKWTVPLIAEAELGDSWNAKLDWISMTKGDPDHPVPDYLEGQVIAEDPEVYVLASGSETPAPKFEPRLLTAVPAAPEPPADTGPATETGPSLAVVEENVEMPAAPPVETAPIPEKAPAGYTKYAVFAVAPSYMTRGTVTGIVRAIQDSELAAYALDKLNEMVLLELRNCDDAVLISYKDGVKVYPEEFAREIRKLNLGPGTYEVYDV